MNFHTIHIDLHGSSAAPEHRPAISDNGDIGDELARASRFFGLEGPADEFSGLWLTHCRYDEFSSLSGNFLERGLKVSVACPASEPLPITPLFSTLQLLLDTLSSSSLSEVRILIETNSMRSFHKMHKPSLRIEDIIYHLFLGNTYTKGIFHSITIEASSHNKPVHYPLSGKKIDLREIGSITTFLWGQNEKKWNQNGNEIRITFK